MEALVDPRNTPNYRIVAKCLPSRWTLSVSEQHFLSRELDRTRWGGHNLTFWSSTNVCCPVGGKVLLASDTASYMLHCPLSKLRFLTAQNCPHRILNGLRPTKTFSKLVDGRGDFHQARRQRWAERLRWSCLYSNNFWIAPISMRRTVLYWAQLSDALVSTRYREIEDPGLVRTEEKITPMLRKWFGHCCGEMVKPGFPLTLHQQSWESWRSPGSFDREKQTLPL